MKPLAEKHFKAFIYENWLYDLSYRKMTYGVEILEGGYIRILEDPIDSNRAYLKRSIEVTFQTGPDDINPKQIEILHELLVPQIDSEGFLSYPKSWSSLPQNYESWVKSIFEDIWDCDEMKKLKLFACKMTDPNVNELYKRQLQQRAYHIVIGKLIEGGHIKEISDATYKHSVLLTHVNLMSYKISGEKLDSFIEETLWRISSRNYDEITLNTIPEFLDTIEIMEAKKPRRLKDKLTSWISDRAFDVAIADFAEEDKEIFRYIKDFVETYGNLGYLHYVDDIPDINLEILKDWLSIILQNRKSLVKDST
ncbi:MAG: hypothetical protein HGN29_08140, partial [Asgard group archaeon]|nr:hypothetical protein [Asgard group archaeon]